MNSAEIVNRYTDLARELEKIVFDAEKRITTHPVDPYFVNNANFLTKSFLISLCCYLEVFLKEMANAHVDNAKIKLRAAKIPHNLLVWSLVRDSKDKDMRLGHFALPLIAKDIDDELSGNPFRTAKCFLKLGVDLDKEIGFVRNKEFVNMVVAKRNSIIHHNDTATDVSLGDIRVYRSYFDEYARAIALAVDAVNMV
jgi:hypothetical protein